MTSKIIYVALTNRQDPWRQIHIKGAVPTWISHCRKFSVVLPYTGTNPNRRQLLRESITGRMRHNKFVHLQRLFDFCFSGLFRLNQEDVTVLDGEIIQPYPELHSTIGLRTISAFDIALRDPDWDYLWRSNASNYVNHEALSLFLEKCARSNFAGGVINYYRGEEYLSGAGFCLSRDIVAKIVENSSNWDHTLFDDVALGRFLKNLGTPLCEIPRISFTHHQTLNSVDIGELRITPSFRCNGISDRAEDVKIMQGLHGLLYNQM